MTEAQAPAGSSLPEEGITAGGESHPALRTQTARLSDGKGEDKQVPLR